MRQPLVSILTPGYNCARFVHRLLDSILAQTWSAIEFIFVDNGSTDGTRDAVLAYKERLERREIAFLYVHKEHGVVASALNAGLRHVRGKYLCWPDSDDFLTPDSIEKRALFLEAHPDYDLVTAEAWVVDESAPEKPVGMNTGLNPNRFDQNHFVQCVMINTCFNPVTHMGRMSAFDEANPTRTIYEHPKEPSGQNFQMLAPLLYKRNRAFLPEPLGYRVNRHDSVMHSQRTARIKNEYQDASLAIIIHTLDAIDMPEDERALYKLLAEKSIALGRMAIGLQHRDKEVFQQGYSAIQRMERESKLIFDSRELSQMRWQKKRMESPLFDFLWRALARASRRFRH